MKSRVNSKPTRAFTLSELVVAVGLIGFMTTTVVLLRVQCSGPELQYMPASGPVPEFTSFMLYPWTYSSRAREAALFNNLKHRASRIRPTLISTNALPEFAPLPAQ